MTCGSCGWKFILPFDASLVGTSSPPRRSSLGRNQRGFADRVTAHLAVGAALALGLVFVVVLVVIWVGGHSHAQGNSTPAEQESAPLTAQSSYQTNAGSDKDHTGYMAQTPDQAAKEVMDQLTSTPAGRAAVDHAERKEEELSSFQRANGISDRIVEAAIKEWVITHNGNFDINLEEVESICLRVYPGS